MSQISPPIRILLVCALAFMAAWMLFLRPKADAGVPAASNPSPATSRPVEAGGPKAESLAGKAVEKANEATAAQDARAEQLAGGAGETAATPATSAASASAPATAGKPATKGADPGKLTAKAAAAGGLPLRVLKALGERKVVVLLFWSPKAAEDRAVRKAVAGIDRHKGKVVAQAAHIKRIAAFGQITRGADVEQSPTVVVVDRDRKVETLVGYVDRTTIDQAVTDALRDS
jgi:predicted nucleotidyltransferase